MHMNTNPNLHMSTDVVSHLAIMWDKKQKRAQKEDQ